MNESGSLPPNFDLNDLTNRVEADAFLDLARERQEQGDMEDAAAYYQMSLDLYPTAEAYTALGTVLAAQGQWEDAIAHCEAAITLDPDLGNPYNDIGVYRIEQNRLNDAIPYLEKAIHAPRYDCPQYPYYHLGRIYERQARFIEARDAYQNALKKEPAWDTPRIALHRTLGFLN